MKKDSRITHPGDRYNLGELYMKQRGEYVWKDDLRDRIDRVLTDPTVRSLADFKKLLKESHVDFNDRYDTAFFGFTTKEGQNRHIRGKKLGTPYQEENLIERIQSH